MTEVERLRDRIIFSNGIPIENADALITAVRSELVAYFIERHQSLTAREIKEAIADIQRANVSVDTRSDSVVAECVTLPVGEKPALMCRGGGPHYCPNCDRTFDDILASLRRK